MPASNVQAIYTPPEPVACPNCGIAIFDGEVIKTRCLDPVKLTAKCRCKAWVDVSAAFNNAN